MARYLLGVTDHDAALLERWLGGSLAIGPADSVRCVLVTALDAVTPEEAAPARARLASSGPLYHAGGPQPPEDRADELERSLRISLGGLAASLPEARLVSLRRLHATLSAVLAEADSHD